MKVKRLKRAARVLTFYRYNFGFHPPHSILLDGTFCQAALANKISLREQMPKYLAEPAMEMFVTECVTNELEQLGKPLHGAHVIAQQFRIAKCPHKPLRTAAECIAHLARRSKKAGATTKYFVATQDDALLEKLRELGGIPLLSIRFNTILLEKPSDQSVAKVEQGKPADELEKVRKMRQIELGEGQEKRHKRRRAKGPNPLSCKKKKSKKERGPPEKEEGGQKNGGAFAARKKKRPEEGAEEKGTAAKKQRRIRKRLLLARGGEQLVDE